MYLFRLAKSSSHSEHLTDQTRKQQNSSFPNSIFLSQSMLRTREHLSITKEGKAPVTVETNPALPAELRERRLRSRPRVLSLNLNNMHNNLRLSERYVEHDILMYPMPRGHDLINQCVVFSVDDILIYSATRQQREKEERNIRHRLQAHITR